MAKDHETSHLYEDGSTLKAMKIYTKTGDDGTTGLFGGKRISKSHIQMEVIGCLDELNAAIGFCLAVESPVQEELLRIQHDLFAIGAEIASPQEKNQIFKPYRIQDLEVSIDEMETSLPQLRNFILPGGSEAGSRIHFARTIARRAERALVRFAEENPVRLELLQFLNRLSDWMFVAARKTNYNQNSSEIPWTSQE